MSLQIALQHRFEGFTLDLAFDAPPGLTALFGPSGSGKTTLVNAVAGLIRPDRGRIVVDGRVLLDTEKGIFLPPHRRRLGYIFQEGRLFPHLSVRQNLLYGRWFAPRARRGESLSRVVEMLGIAPLLDRRPQALSGGEKQRVAIGRALLAGPELLLADEPLAALDDARKAEILPYFRLLRDELQVPILYVSHSVTEVAQLATTVVALEGGRLAAIGVPDQVLCTFTDNADKEFSILNALVVAQHDDGLSELSAAGGTLWLAHMTKPPGGKIRVAIAAEDVMLSRERPTNLSALNILSGQISDIQSQNGTNARIVLAVGTERLVADIPRRAALEMGLAIGQSCHAVIRAVASYPAQAGAR